MGELDKYFEYLPVFIIALVASFLLTPLAGYIARKVGAIDLPASMRKSDERGINTRMHKVPLPRLGGLAVVVPFIILAIIFLPFEKQLIGVLAGVLILTIGGYLDDKRDLSSGSQFLFQILAALAVVFTGTGISSLNIPLLGELNLELWEIPINIQGLAYNISLPSDLITIVWIFLVINSINWVAGIDGLVEGITGISAIIITLLSVRFFTHPTAIMGAILAGGVIGFLPYNFNPAKIISGTVGTFNYGFLLAVLSIYSGAKFATATMLLGIPILDAIWVIFYRIKKAEDKTIKGLMKAVTESDKVHLHHRLLEMGLTVRQVDYIEYSIVAILGVIAFSLTGLTKMLALFIAMILLIVFLQLTNKKIKINLPKKKATLELQEEESPEKKFAY